MASVAVNDALRLHCFFVFVFVLCRGLCPPLRAPALVGRVFSVLAGVLSNMARRRAGVHVFFVWACIL